MFGLKKAMEQSPAVARVAPFVIFLFLTALQGQLGAASAFWVYLGKSVVGIYLIWLMWPLVTEMRWKFSWEAVVVGVAVCVMWVGVDASWTRQDSLWIKLGISHPPEKPALPWNPLAFFGDSPALAWTCVVGRIAASTLVVPHMEETFYRSFLYRYLHRPKFETVPLGTFAWLPFAATAVIFGVAHNEWLGGILCGAAYQWLVVRKQRLGDAMTAHAITNFLLGLYIVWQHFAGKDAWRFW
jgi:membrane protease YdiL (CAAX protease family)